MTDPNVGLIAGQGQLPFLVAQGVRAEGGRVCCVGLRDQYDGGLRERCDEFGEAGIVQLGRWIRLLRRWDVSEAVMVGRVDKARMHDPFRIVRQLPDWRAVVLWYRRLRHDHRTPAVLAAVADALGENGITLIDSTTHIPEHLATEGTMGAVEPTASQRLDTAFAWPILERLLELGIGQAMAVRERDVIAVEAVEGTDRMVDRAGELCPRRGWVLLKSSRADHDRRADVPTIGVRTVERVAESGGRCIAVGAGRVILVDKPQVIAAADGAGVALLGIDATPDGSGG
jgi:DUF1009 family protein